MQSRRPGAAVWCLGAIVLAACALAGGAAASGGHARLAVTLSHSPEPATVGGAVTFALGVSNLGKKTVDDVTLTLSLPDGLSLTAGGSGCGGDPVVCPVGDLGGGQGRSFAVVATASRTGELVARATAAGNRCGEGCRVSSNVAADTVTVVGGEEPPPPPPPPSAPVPPPPPPAASPAADMSVVVALAPADPVAGQVTELRITATNHGPDDAGAVSVLAEAPRGAQFVAGSTSRGSCVGGVVLACSIGTLSAPAAGLVRPPVSRVTLAVGESVLVVQRLRLPSAGPAEARVTLQSSASDPNSANNRRVLDFAVRETPRTPAGQPPPPPPPPPADDDGKPNANETVVVQELVGRVRVKLPRTDRFVELGSLAAQELPNGTVVDARKGRFRLYTAAPGGQIEFAEFYRGASAVRQVAPEGAGRTPAQSDVPGVTELALALGNFGAPCRVPGTASTAARTTQSLTGAEAKPKPRPRKKAKAKKKAKPAPPAKPRTLVRRLWGNGEGRFRTRGRFSAATVRGTIWVTEDYCNGTRVRVREGTVEVTDPAAEKTVTVRAGESYFVEAPTHGGADG